MLLYDFADAPVSVSRAAKSHDLCLALMQCNVLILYSLFLRHLSFVLTTLLAPPSTAQSQANLPLTGAERQKSYWRPRKLLPAINKELVMPSTPATRQLTASEFVILSKAACTSVRGF